LILGFLPRVFFLPSFEIKGDIETALSLKIANGVESDEDEEDDDTEEDDEVEMQSRELVRATTGSLSVILMISIKKKL
jgi:hypothetical protein